MGLPSRAPDVPPFVSELPQTAVSDHPDPRSEQAALVVVRRLRPIL
jgi:hypothetical protein